MLDRAQFFHNVRESLFNGVFEQSQVDGLNHLLDVWEARYSNFPQAFLAYALSTVFHETARTMRPIEEYGRGRGRAYGPSGYYGRGYLQLTWEANYRKASDMLAKLDVTVDLVSHPEQALDPDVAALILFEGMNVGLFTGKRFSDYLPGNPVGARRIINGTDRAQLIATYYGRFLGAFFMLPSTVVSPSAGTGVVGPAPHIEAPIIAPVIMTPPVSKGFWSTLHSALSRKD